MPTHGGLETLLPSAAISSWRPSGQSDSAAHPHLNLTHSQQLRPSTRLAQAAIRAADCHGAEVAGTPTPSAARASPAAAGTAKAGEG
jgi:hypothetical protein